MYNSKIAFLLKLRVIMLEGTVHAHHESFLMLVGPLDRIDAHNMNSTPELSYEIPEFDET
jgi:hypothetical protein